MPFKQKLAVLSIFLLGFLVVISSSTFLFPVQWTILTSSHPSNLRLQKRAAHHLHRLHDRDSHRRYRRLSPRPSCRLRRLQVAVWYKSQSQSQSRV